MRHRIQEYSATVQSPATKLQGLVRAHEAPVPSKSQGVGPNGLQTAGVTLTLLRVRG